MELDLETAYKVDGWRGIAWRLEGYVQYTEECQGHPDDGEFNGPIGETFYCDGSCEEPQDDLTKVRMHMVGDNRTFEFHIDDISPISDEEFCPECGQIGCKVYG